MQRLALALVPLLLLACDRELVAPEAQAPPAFAATSEWTEEIYDNTIGDVYYAPCIDDNVDEVGPMQLVFHTVSTDNGTQFSMKVRFLPGYHLVGDDTGHWYPKVVIGTEVERASFENGSFGLKYNLDPFMFVNEATGVVMNFPFRAHVTINANGQLTVDRTVGPCKILGN